MMIDLEGDGFYRYVPWRDVAVLQMSGWISAEHREAIATLAEGIAAGILTQIDAGATLLASSGGFLDKFDERLDALEIAANCLETEVREITEDVRKAASGAILMRKPMAHTMTVARAAGRGVIKPALIEQIVAEEAATWQRLRAPAE